MASSAAFQRSCNIVGLTNRDALDAYQRFMALSFVAFRDEPTEIEPVWYGFAGLSSASPKVWMDAYLAAFAVASGLELVTFDGGFSQFAAAEPATCRCREPSGTEPRSGSNFVLRTNLRLGSADLLPARGACDG